MDIFLILIGFAWVLVASIQDLRKREVWNWLSFSLIITALAYRAFSAAYNSNIWIFVYGVLGLFVFVILGYALYYARVFAGGDAKLLFGLGVVLPLSASLVYNLIIFGGFIVLLLFAGSVYGLIYSFFLVLGNRKSFSIEFSKQLRKYQKFTLLLSIVAIIFIILPIFMRDIVFLLFPVIIFLLPVLYVYGKAIENSCMIKEIRTNQLAEGDWIYEKVRIGKKIVKPYWEGLSSEELKILRKYGRRVKIRVGIPFVPGFLIAFLILVYLVYSGVLLRFA
ncbi:MAG: prepilin peptidase [Nanoarchaeota archaeon]|nr:prepilin peptidase [Nanoarchaeota archaeon]